MLASAHRADAADRVEFVGRGREHLGQRAEAVDHRLDHRLGQPRQAVQLAVATRRDGRVEVVAG